MTRTWRWWWGPAIGFGTWFVLIGVVAVLTFTIDGRASIDIYRFLRTDSPFSHDLPGGRIATDDLCPGVTGCVQAVDSRTAVIRKFDRRSQADQRAAEAERAGTEVHLSGWVVVEYKGDDLFGPARASFEQGIDGINVDSPD